MTAPRPLKRFSSQKSLDAALSERIAAILREKIALNGVATLAVSGGKSPRGLFTALSTQILDWDKVIVTLVDERAVDRHDDASNHKLVTGCLLQKHAAKARFISLNCGEDPGPAAIDALTQDLKQAGIPPLDVTVLGMGTDGHTASLFPCARESAYAMSGEAPPLALVRPETAAYQRITLTLNSLLQSGHVFLYLLGEEKLKVLEKAQSGVDASHMPIRALLHSDAIAMEIFWAPD